MPILVGFRSVLWTCKQRLRKTEVLQQVCDAQRYYNSHLPLPHPGDSWFLSVNKFLKDLRDLRKFFAQSFRTALSINGGSPPMHSNEKHSVRNKLAEVGKAP